MIRLKRPVLSKAVCIAHARALLLRLWEVVFLSLVAIMLMGPATGPGASIALARFASGVMDVTAFLWRRLRRPAERLSHDGGARNGLRSDSPEWPVARPHTASARGM